MVNSVLVNNKPLPTGRDLIMFLILSLGYPMDTQDCLGTGDTAGTNTNEPACLHDLSIPLWEGVL